MYIIIKWTNCIVWKDRLYFDMVQQDLQIGNTASLYTLQIAFCEYMDRRFEVKTQWNICK